MKLKKILSIVLCVAMVLSTMGTVVFAEETEVVLAEGTYTSLSDYVGKTMTVKAADGAEVIFDLSGGINMGGANIVFEGVTFNWPNKNYQGLQHSGNLTYKNCEINGQVFLYGETETFENCTFNQTSSDAYNVWTYGAGKADFIGCTFNSAGKSVLVYHEGKANVVNVENSTFNASTAVSGKAAIEIDTSLMDGETIVTVDDASDAIGFAEDTISGNSLWNVKKDPAKAGSSTIVTVANNPVYEKTINCAAKIGETKFVTIQDAVKAAQTGDTVEIMPGTYEMPSIQKQIKIVGVGDVKVTNQISVSHNTVEMENIDFVNPNGNCLRWCYANGDVKFTDCSFIAQTYAVHFDGGNGTVTFDGCEFSGWTSFGSQISKVTFNNCNFRQDSTSGYNYVRVYQDADLTDCSFDGTVVGMADKTAVLNVNNCNTADGRDLLDVFEDAKIEYGTIYIDNNLVGRAKIGNTSYNTFADALEDTKNMSGDVTIDLCADVKLSYGAREAYGAQDTDSITINGNGYELTLNQTDSDWSSIGMANSDGTFKMNDVNVVKSGYGVPKGAWNTHAINFNVNVEFTDVNFDNSIKVGGTYATLTNVNIVEDEGYYGIWIPADAQSVTINGGSITATNGGRGIKIADEYVASPANVNLNVTGMTFETAKKAAVLVSSTAGATITASDNDITKVAEDSVNFAWVDEDWASYNNLVTVNGKSVPVESDIATTVSVSFAEEAPGLYNIVLTGHNGEINEFVGAELTFANTSLTVANEKMQYEILGIADKTNAEKSIEKDDTYALRLVDGANRMSGDEFVIGQVKFYGMGNINFTVSDGKVVTTEYGTNLENYYTVQDKDLVAVAITDGQVVEVKRDVKVNVAYNHILINNKWADNKITVTLKDGFGNFYGPFDVSDGIETIEDVKLGRLTVTLEAPGFRKYVYNTTLEAGADEDDALVLNFWNNVKRNTSEDLLKEIEAGKGLTNKNFVVGDIVMDYIVDEYDLAAVTSYYGMYGIENNDKFLMYDLNRDGNIDIIDVAFVLHTLNN